MSSTCLPGWLTDRIADTGFQGTVAKVYQAHGLPKPQPAFLNINQTPRSGGPTLFTFPWQLNVTHGLQAETPPDTVCVLCSPCSIVLSTLQDLCMSPEQSLHTHMRAHTHIMHVHAQTHTCIHTHARAFTHTYTHVPLSNYFCVLIYNCGQPRHCIQWCSIS